MMPICKKSEFMLCQVCLQEDKQTTYFLDGVQIHQSYANIIAAPSTLWCFSDVIDLQSWRATVLDERINDI